MQVRPTAYSTTKYTCTLFAQNKERVLFTFLYLKKKINLCTMFMGSKTWHTLFPLSFYSHREKQYRILYNINEVEVKAFSKQLFNVKN